MSKSKHSVAYLIHSRITSILSITLVLILLGMTATLLLFAGQLTAYVRENLTVTVVLDDDLPEADVQKLRKRLDAAPYSKSTRFEDKASALEELKKELGSDPTEILGYNPLSASIEMRLHSAWTVPDSMASVQGRIASFPGVKEVICQDDLVDDVNHNVTRMSLIMVALAALMLIISYALVSNTVRLGVYARRFLIHTMKLVGATPGYIRRPFLRDGAVMGLIAALLAIAALSTGMYWLNDELDGIFSFESLRGLLAVYALVLLAGEWITMTAMFLAVNKYLRTKSNELYTI